MNDFTPEWDTTAGGAKLLLTGSMLPQARPQAQRGPLYVMFDQLEVRTRTVTGSLFTGGWDGDQEHS